MKVVGRSAQVQVVSTAFVVGLLVLAVAVAAALALLDPRSGTPESRIAFWVLVSLLAVFMARSVLRMGVADALRAGDAPAARRRMATRWRVETDTTSEAKARTLVERLELTLGVDCLTLHLEPRDPGGHVATFVLDHGELDRNDAVALTLELAQRVGAGWVVTGPVQDDFGAFSTDARLPGVVSMDWHLAER